MDPPTIPINGYFPYYTHSTSSSAPPIISGDLEAGFSPAPYSSHYNSTSNGSYRSIGFFYDAPSDGEPDHHFLDSCHRCKTPLAGNSDIFMYRGNIPFCGEDCRQEQIELDEANEKKNNKTKKPSFKRQFSVKEEQQRKIHVRDTGTLVAL